MPNNSDDRKAEATAVTTSENPNPDNVVKAFLVGHCKMGMYPIFAEAAIKDNGALRLDHSRDGLRFVGRDGQEHTHLIPITTVCYPGALIEIKKYLYGVDVAWAPQGVDNSQLTRDRDRRGAVEAALENYFRSRGASPTMEAAEAIAYLVAQGPN